MAKTIQFPLHKIVITLGDVDPGNPGAYLSGAIDEDELAIDKDPADIECNAAFDGITSTILAHAIAGIDVTAPAYVEGVEVALESMANKYL